MTNNSGISITGGTVNAGAMAAGHGARATNTTSQPRVSLDNLRREMASLVDLVQTYAAQLGDGQQTITVAAEAQQELAKGSPDKRRFLTTLERLASGVGSVGSLATAVAAIQQTATSFF